MRPRRYWIKPKCPDQPQRGTRSLGPRNPERANASGYWSGSARARVLERLPSPELSVGSARELRKQEAIVEREITELE